jgi:hypothetical protein
MIYTFEVYMNLAKTNSAAGSFKTKADRQEAADQAKWAFQCVEKEILAAVFEAKGADAEESARARLVTGKPVWNARKTIAIRSYLTDAQAAALEARMVQAIELREAILAMPIVK